MIRTLHCWSLSISGGDVGGPNDREAWYADTLYEPSSAWLQVFLGKLYSKFDCYLWSWNGPNAKSEEKVWPRVKAELDSQTLSEATKDLTMDAANSMTQEQKSSMRAAGQGSISIIAGKLSEIAPEEHESVPFE